MLVGRSQLSQSSISYVPHITFEQVTPSQRRPLACAGVQTCCDSAEQATRCVGDTTLLIPIDSLHEGRSLQSPQPELTLLLQPAGWTHCGEQRPSVLCRHEHMAVVPACKVTSHPCTEAASGSESTQRQRVSWMNTPRNHVQRNVARLARSDVGKWVHVVVVALTQRRQVLDAHLQAW